jgi:hypothetical protein
LQPVTSTRGRATMDDHGRGRCERQPSEVGDVEVPHEQSGTAGERDRSHRDAGAVFHKAQAGENADSTSP